jgi:DNA-binding transcriptional LysR family regulator
MVPVAIGCLQKQDIGVSDGLGIAQEGRRTVPQIAREHDPAALAAAEAGRGIAPALSYMVAGAVRDGRLSTILDELSPAPVPVHLVRPAGRLVPPRVRAFMDFAAPRLAEALADLAPEGPSRRLRADQS